MVKMEETGPLPMMKDSWGMKYFSKLLKSQSHHQQTPLNYYRTNDSIFMSGCAGIIHCNRKVCLEMSICEKNIDFSRDNKVRQRKPAKARRAELVWTATKSKKKKKKDNSVLVKAARKQSIKPAICVKNCEWMCSILGQCVYDHPLVAADDTAAREIKDAKDRKQVMAVIERLMPALNRGNWKKRSTITK
jgi:hypothetical protein